MNDLYLKATDEAALIEALPFARGEDEQGNAIWIQTTHDYALDIVGDIYNDDAVFGEEVDETGALIAITPPTKVEGFHANLRSNDDIAALVPQSIIIEAPATPTRIWSGN